MVDELIIFSFYCFKAPAVSVDGWALAKCMEANKIKKKIVFFMGLDIL
jgi:hypothetical protein